MPVFYYSFVLASDDARKEKSKSSSCFLIVPDGSFGTLVGKYGLYTVDYDKDTSVERIKPLQNNMVSDTAR